jgi:hypothetical protein
VINQSNLIQIACIRMRSFLLLFILLCVLIGSLSAANGEINLLYQYEAELFEAVEILEHKIATAEDEFCADPAPFISLPKKIKAIVVDGPKLKIPKDANVRILNFVKHKGKSHWLLQTEDGTSCLLKNKKSWLSFFRPEYLNHKKSIAEDSTKFIRNRMLLEIEFSMKKNELEELSNLTKLYRKSGRHKQMDPIDLLKCLALPFDEDHTPPIPFAWSQEMRLSNIPWGKILEPQLPGADEDWPVLLFSGFSDDAWEFEISSSDASTLDLELNQPEAINHLYFMPTHVSQESGFGDFIRLAEDIKLRKRNARKYGLLIKWKPDEVNRILDGIVWKDMSKEMLIEALGEPASVNNSADDVETWNYAEGNAISLKANKVVGIRQE